MATRKKAQPKEGIVSSPERKSKTGKTTAKTSVSNDIIGSAVPENTIDLNPVKKPAKAEKETVAVHSTKNVVWEGVGKVEKGYNIIKKAEAEKWLTRDHIRLATPEEVAREYGV